MDATGVPLSLVVSGANVNDHRELPTVLRRTVVRRPRPGPRRQQHLCADKGYDYPATRRAVAARGYVPHIPRRGAPPPPRRPRGKRARRWVVEACQSWLNRFRKLLVRFEKKTCNYEALLSFACAIICWRHAGVLG